MGQKGRERRLDPSGKSGILSLSSTLFVGRQLTICDLSAVFLQIGAMLISSGTGMVLDTGVSKYRGFALLAISMTGQSAIAPRLVSPKESRIESRDFSVFRSDRFDRGHPRQSPLHNASHESPSIQSEIEIHFRSLGISTGPHSLPRSVSVSRLLSRFCELGRMDRSESRLGRLDDLCPHRMSRLVHLSKRPGGLTSVPVLDIRLWSRSLSLRD